eukprot:scaffold2092_cov144-Amphora_coffeaeformis.AAC.1
MAEDTTPTTNNDQRLNLSEEQTQKLFPVGKLYASPRALCFDVEEFAVRHRFSVLRGAGDDDSVMCCAGPNCKFRIIFESNSDGGAAIVDRSVYRHSKECGGVNRQSGTCEKSSSQWIELQEAKEFSRLLYTNPVCFLGTRATMDPTTTNDNNLEFNVMILSWLTATNNEGSFMFSLNKHRHTATVLRDEFTLSVPVQGMEDLILGAGGVSGKWGFSKFEKERKDPTTETTSTASMASRSKKRKGPRFPTGIPHLERVSLGQDTEGSTGWPFAVKGTVAHLLCRVIHIAERTDWIDNSHYVVFAKITRAYVKSSYWNASKKLFQPAPGFPPYLTFFGSQTFGYVIPDGNLSPKAAST